MDGLFVVINTRGPRWNSSRPMEGQAGWAAHATFMDRLAEEGFIVIGGPLEGTPDSLIVVRAGGQEQIAQRLAADPWRRDGLLSLKQLSPWSIRLGSLS